MPRRERAPRIGLTGEDWWGAFDLRWPRGPYRILETPDSMWGQVLHAVPRRRVPFMEARPGAPWVLERREVPAPSSPIYGAERGRVPSAGETANLYRLAWPAGGIFVPVDGAPARPAYDPIPLAEVILLAAQAAATADEAGLLDFVNRWGCLGVGIPGQDDFGADGVGRTGEALRELADWVATLHALQRGTRTERSWADLVALFESRLRGVRLSAQLTRRGLVPRLPLGRLLDVPYLELWGVATGGQRLRRCKRCAHFFIRGRADQIFCTGPCARRWHVREWKRQHRRARRESRR